MVARAVAKGYAVDHTDNEIQQLGRDPFLVASAMVSEGRCVVTTEVSKPGRRRANRHLPDVCASFGVTSCNTFELTRRLNFRTQWRPPTT